MVGDPISAPLVNVDIKPCGEPDSVNIADGIQVLCRVAPLISTEHDVILTTDVTEEDLNHLPVASVCNVQVCVTDMVNACDDNCDVNDVVLILILMMKCQGVFTIIIIIIIIRAFVRRTMSASELNLRRRQCGRYYVV